MMYRFIACLLLVPAFLYIGGLVWFGMTLPTKVSNPFQKTDAIVVLTGGVDRIDTALDLMRHHRAQKLLISGVNPQTTLKDILATVSVAHQNLKPSDIDLDYRSDNTFENAQQAARWIREHHFRSVRLVTAHYHIRRSLLEFFQTLPDIEIIAHPVVPRIFQKKEWIQDFGAVAVLCREYHKYMGVLLRHIWSGNNSIQNVGAVVLAIRLVPVLPVRCADIAAHPPSSDFEKRRV
ncbi:MAG: YdcF family protein [Caedimonas sp.]|nr:YdcF family protein [Caedimonas sp.]